MSSTLYCLLMNINFGKLHNLLRICLEGKLKMDSLSHILQGRSINRIHLFYLQCSHCSKFGNLKRSKFILVSTLRQILLLQMKKFLLNKIYNYLNKIRYQDIHLFCRHCIMKSLKKSDLIGKECILLLKTLFHKVLNLKSPQYLSLDDFFHKNS